MAARRKRRSGKANTPQAKRFGTAARGANLVCHRETNSVGAYKTCMRREMKARLGGGKKRRRRKKR
jgi:hypothetical protein